MRKLFLVLVVGLCMILATAVYSVGAKSNSQETLWGAIAYSTSTHAYGFGYNQPSQAAAINVAVEKCNEDDCKAVVWFHNSCGAFAIGDRAAYGWGIDSEKEEAQEKALSECRKAGTGCKIVQWVCTANRGG